MYTTVLQQPRSADRTLGEVSERVIAFIDGLNVYQGMIASRLRRMLWLDHVALVEQFLQPAKI